MDTETIFKKAIANNLNQSLTNLGYEITNGYKGFIQYECSKNILVFVFDWQRAYDFECRLRFKDELIDYPVEEIIRKLENTDQVVEPEFTDDYNLIFNKWTSNLSKQLVDKKIQSISKDSPIIRQSKVEILQQTKDYNLELRINQIKRSVDKAWSEKNYETVVNLLTKDKELLPKSYDKKFQIAKKRINQ